MVNLPPTPKRWQESEKCGVVGIVGPNISLSEIVKAQTALEHRGNGPAGVVMQQTDGSIFREVAESIELLPTASQLPATVAIAHNRYATSASTSMENTQPFVMSEGKFTLSFAHNGNIPERELDSLRLLLKKDVSETASDSAIMTHLLIEARSSFSNWTETFVHILPLFKGAFSITCFTEEGQLFAIRDPYGNRPLCIGQKDGRWIAASETVALDAIDAEYLREVLPGEIICLKANGEFESTLYSLNPEGNFRCLLETIYFAKKESFDGRAKMEHQRMALGRAAARRFKEKNIQIDWIVPILNSGLMMATGAAAELSIPFYKAIGVKGKKRSFIQNTQAERVMAVNEKHVIWDPQYSQDIEGKSILMCDDSAVRGTSLQTLLQNIKEIKGTKPAQIHILLGSEPVKDICDLGVDLPDPAHLLANKVGAADLSDLEIKVAAFLGIQSVTYLDREGVETALGKFSNEMCFHCFGGPHPVRAHRPPLYRKDKVENLMAQKVLFLASGNGSNVETLVEKMQSGVILAQPVGVITNKRKAGVIEKAQNHHLPVKIISSAHRLSTDENRLKYESDLLDGILNEELEKPDVVVLAGWMLILSDSFIQTLHDHKIKIINLHPALLSGNADDEVMSSRGLVPELRGAHAIDDTVKFSLAKMPVAGASVHLVNAENEFDEGEVILKEEVQRREGEALSELTVRIHAAEHRILATALQKVLLEKVIDVSLRKIKDIYAEQVQSVFS